MAQCVFVCLIIFSDPDLWIHPADSRILTLNAGEIVISDTFSAGVTLRFPRINKIREGADDKPRSDIESDLSLWKIFQDVTESRSGVDSGESIKLGSSVKHDIHKECRFMTEEQLQLLKGKTKRSISSKRAPGVVIPTMTKRESYVLKGLTFHVFEGSYGLSYNSSAMHEAMEQGWIREGRRVSSSSDVQTFLVNHGGRHILTPDGEDTIVVGGSRGDPKVLAFIRSIETAYVKQSSRLKSKKIEQVALATLKQGCLRWMYVYSLVHRWLDKTKSSELPIKDSDPDFLRPSVLDYLARPEKTGEKVDGIDLQLLTADLTSVSDIRRAIEIVSEATSCSKSEKINRSDAKSWQKEAVERLTKDERWAVACKHQVLWPYSEDHEPDGLVLIYPHIFRDFGNIESSDSSTEHVERWKSALPLAQANAIESVIPLARVMGAIVTPHLHRLVTHVLCDLRGVDVLKYDGDVTNEVFVARQRGSDLLKRLEEIRKHTSHEIHLISATWLRKRKWQS